MRTFRKRWSLILGCFFPASILNQAINTCDEILKPVNYLRKKTALFVTKFLIEHSLRLFKVNKSVYTA